ncbi:MAG: protein kinase domain-containing protein [Dehalococcoidia bacterium]
MPELGDTIAHFRLDAKLGTGGFATVYRARDLRLARDVALKLLHPQFAADEAFLARFDAEARVAAGIRHPNLVTLHDIGATDAGVPFLVMELLEGETLRLLLRRQDAFSLADVATLMAQLAAALDALHARQIVHRDLKPENVIVDGVGHATLMDFGIARSLDAASLTVVGQTVGTPIYMAPEQITGGAIGPGVDRYALGILAYELLSGRPPFTGTPTAVMRAHEAEPPPPLRSLNQRVPAAVATAVERMLAKRPEDRFSSAGEFATILGATIEDETGRLTIRLPSRQETPLAVAVNVALQEAAAVGQPTGTLTLLFTDIEGSTRLLHSLGDRYPSVLAQHRDLLRSTFRTHRGHEVDTQGDAFFAVFARASEAVAAAVAGQRALAAQRWPDETTLRVRMGLHTGEPQPTAEGYAGLDLHRGARIASAAHGG